ncbi:hypothetical protein DXM27_03895 [Rhizobium rhizogenes]|uniref:Uncharacterized protein n=1 Tax=Rhizobium rhizogenes TaxID=359 RepID=A0AA88F5Z6_RHIRH|nr:hypothetical protein DXM27_03895 [Rhizobium rhizogenes]
MDNSPAGFLRANDPASMTVPFFEEMLIRNRSARNKVWLFLFFQWHNQNRCNAKREACYEP